MALNAGEARFLAKARAKIGSKGSTSAHALHSYKSHATLITSRMIADEFRRKLRINHSDFVSSTPAYVDDKMREVLMRHSIFRGGSLAPSNRSTTGLEPKDWVYARLFDPLGTMSTAMHLSYKHTKSGATIVYIRGADIKFQEYGTGYIGKEIESHPEAGKVGWAYGIGAHIKDDEKTGIPYWVFGQYARVGSPAGHFVYDAREEMKEDLSDGGFKGKIVYDLQQPTKELISTMFISELGR